jgi:hypothetical protein
MHAELKTNSETNYRLFSSQCNLIQARICLIIPRATSVSTSPVINFPLSLIFSLSSGGTPKGAQRQSLRHIGKPIPLQAFAPCWAEKRAGEIKNRSEARALARI